MLILIIVTLSLVLLTSLTTASDFDVIVLASKTASDTIWLGIKATFSALLG